MIHLLAALVIAFQPLPAPPVTTFAQHCYTLEDSAFTVYFGYTSDSARHFVGGGFDFVTQVGAHPDALHIAAGYLPAPDVGQVSLIEVISTGDPALDALTGGYGEQVVVVFDWPMLPECGHEDELPKPLPYNEPLQVECSRWAIDGGTGISYCYTPQANGVIPLPPAP